jgi:hypothetical protein
MDPIDGDVQMVVAGLTPVDGHHVLMLAETDGRQSVSPGLEGLDIRRMLPIPPAQDEMYVRIGRP